MAAPLRIGFGSRKIWTEHIKNYQCTNIHAFVQICTFLHENPPNCLNYRASVHQAAKLVAALLRVAVVTAGLAESNDNLPSGL